MSNITTINSPIQPITFKAVWTDENKHLDESFVEKITRYALFFINRIAGALILPSILASKKDIQAIDTMFKKQWSLDYNPDYKFLKNNFSPLAIRVTTPDNVEIEGTFFKNVRATNTSPTVVFFQPNAALSKEGIFNWLLKLAALQEIPYNFVYFDYRGCVTDTWPNSSKDLYLDGESIYQFIRDELHVPAKDIHFYEFSLGGGVSSHIKEIHKECTGRYVIDRSFTSLNDTIRHILGKALGFIPTLLTSLLNWNMPSAKALENLRGKTLIVHHPKDELMGSNASLYRYFFESQAAPASGLISHLDLSRADQNVDFYHGAPLYYFANEEIDPPAEIAKFLFSSDLSLEQRMVQIYRNSKVEFQNKVHEVVAMRYQDGGFYWGSGADACNNRNGLSISESELSQAIYCAKMGI